MTRRSTPHDRRPRIGVTPDEGTSGGEFGLPQYHLKRAYTQAVLDAGGLPLVLPYTSDLRPRTNTWRYATGSW